MRSQAKHTYRVTDLVGNKYIVLAANKQDAARRFSGNCEPMAAFVLKHWKIERLSDKIKP